MELKLEVAKLPQCKNILSVFCHSSRTKYVTDLDNHFCLHGLPITSSISNMWWEAMPPLNLD